MEERELSALDAYINRVYRIILLIIPAFCITAGVTFTVMKAVGWFPEINTGALAVFDLSTVLYLLAGLYFVRTGFDENGIIRKDKLKAAKAAVVVMLGIQWNFISYMVPFADFWAFSFLFVVIVAFFFDIRLVLCTTGVLSVSMVVSWLVIGEPLFRYGDRMLRIIIVFRATCLMHTFLALALLTFFGGRYLVEELEKYVSHDTLTRLLNRRSMDSYLNTAYQKAQTGDAFFCLLMVDLDDFKRVNDTYGHECGDEVLREVSARVLKSVQKNDSVFRWGGEEILVMLMADRKTAAETAERIRRTIAAEPVVFQGGVNVPVTATLGLAEYHSGVTVKGMIEEADEKLYKGKRNGKNQVVV